MPDAANTLPRHVGIIMDGNGRWAAKRGLPRTAGHREGLRAAKRIVREAARLGIATVTLYTFSTENWKRTQEEVGFLMELIMAHLRSEFEFYRQNRIRIRHVGNTAGLPAKVAGEIRRAVEETAGFSGLTVVLAINYGGRDEIARAAGRALAALESGAALGGGEARVTEESFAAFLDAPDLPDVDLLIRTGGEKRFSNFLLWQAAYAELVFSDTLWPDYSESEFALAVEDFSRRERRFGGLA